MFGIAKHDPIALTIMLDRSKYKAETITEDDTKMNVLADLVADSSQASVLYVVGVSCLKKLLKEKGASAIVSKLKLVVLDNPENLQAAGIDVVDAEQVNGEWQPKYLVSTKVFNDLIKQTNYGMPESPEQPEPKLRQKATPPGPTSDVWVIDLLNFFVSDIKDKNQADLYYDILVNRLCGLSEEDAFTDAMEDIKDTVDPQKVDRVVNFVNTSSKATSLRKAYLHVMQGGNYDEAVNAYHGKLDAVTFMKCLDALLKDIPPWE